MAYTRPNLVASKPQLHIMYQVSDTNLLNFKNGGDKIHDANHDAIHDAIHDANQHIGVLFKHSHPRTFSTDKTISHV